MYILFIYKLVMVLFIELITGTQTANIVTLGEWKNYKMALNQDDDTQPIIDSEDGAQSIRRSARDNEMDPQATCCGGSACCNPSSGIHRFSALIFMCLLGFGNYLIISLVYYY